MIKNLYISDKLAKKAVKRDLSTLDLLSVNQKYTAVFTDILAKKYDTSFYDAVEPSPLDDYSLEEISELKAMHRNYDADLIASYPEAFEKAESDKIMIKSFPK